MSPHLHRSRPQATPASVRHVAAVLWLAAAGLAQAPPAAPAAPVPAVDPALPELLKELKAMVGDLKMREDFRAINLVQKLVENPDQRNPKDKERIAKALGDVFRTGKVRAADKDHLYREAGDALGKLGEDGGKELMKVLEDARHKDALALQAHLILALGRTQDGRQVEWLTDTATRSQHDEIRGAAGEALGNFVAIDAKQKRDIVKALIREWGSLHQMATTPDPTDPNAPQSTNPQNARRTLRVIEGRWMATLTKLTGASHSQFPDWQRWLNKNPNWVPPGAKKA
jgi:hypothetical protein